MPPDPFEPTNDPPGTPSPPAHEPVQPEREPGDQPATPDAERPPSRTGETAPAPDPFGCGSPTNQRADDVTP